jgi:multisubunit Na+/H+ antiporter MnhG subunit
MTEAKMYQLRPIGVSLIAMLNFFFAGLMLPRLVVILDYPFRTWSFPLFGYTLFSDPVSFVTDDNRSIVLVLVLVQLVVYLVTAIGLWQLKEWARLIAIINSILAIGLTASRHFITPITGATLLEALTLLFVVLYLTHPSVSQAFIQAISRKETTRHPPT